jgi:beta-glucanase (GH16 family)
MMLRSRRMLRCAVPLTVVWLLSACADGDREQPLTRVETIDIPVADTTTTVNINIDNPTLNIPDTFQVSDGDLLTLVWNDEFNDAQLDPELWFFESGDGSQYGIPGWGNNELQWYLPDNASLEDGKLKITAKRESVDDFGFTSARINTADRFAFKYGRIEASIKMPSGQGLWPAFWMFSQDSDYLCNGDPCDWAAIGEIDIVEAVNLDGSGGNEIFSTIHYGGEFPANESAETRYTPSEDVTGQFNTYALEWDEFEIRWYFNGVLYAVQNNWFSTAAPYPAPFDQHFYILLNLAVGGNFPGSPDGSTPFPATMEVDWVRVYSGEEPAVEPADPGTIPEVVIYATDPNETVDLVFGEDYTGFEPFGSGSSFNNNNTTDRDFSPAFGVTTGDGYGAQVGQFAIVGFAGGFATGYETLHFKAKGLNNDLIRVKFLDAGEYVDINLAASGYATALGNGWYQVSVPMVDFAGVDTATALLFETDNTAPAAFTFLLTDIGFDVGGGGGPGPGGDTVLVTFDEAVPPAVTEFGGAGYAIEPGPAGGDGNALKIARNGGEVFAGAWVAIPSIPNDAGVQTLSALVYSPTAGVPIVTKVEFADNQGTGDVQANEAVVVGWQTLTWTYTNLAAPNDYNRFTILPNLGVVDTATDYYFDNITLLDAGDGGGGEGGELAANGDFETGDLTGWTTFDNGGTIEVVADNGPSSAGTFAGHINVTIPGNPTLKQANVGVGEVTPGQTVTVSFDWKGTDAAGGVVDVVLFSELAGGGVSQADAILAGAGFPADWTPVGPLDITVGPDVSGGITLQITAICGGVAGCVSDIFIDNVSITIP